MNWMPPLLLGAAVVVLAASGLVYLAFTAEVGRARTAIIDRGRIASTPSGPIEYAEHGSGPPLLSIHGAGGGYDQGLANAADFIADGFRVIAPSRFGYLGTPIPADASDAAQADAHADLLVHLRIGQSVVVGISAGARSAVELALRHPERVGALILIVPAAYAPISPVAIEASRGSQFAYWLVNAGADFAWWATERIAPALLIRFMGVPADVLAAASRADQDRVRQIIRGVQPLSRRFPGINIDSNPALRRPPLEKIRAPTLVIAARDDLFNTLPAAEFAAATIPHAELVVHAKGGHLLVGHEREVRSKIGHFLARVGVRSS